jgi:hypothetical protein
MQRALEILGRTDTDNPQPPEWVKGGFDGAADGPPDGAVPAVACPPPTRGFVGAAAGYVVIAACVALLVVLLGLSWLVGN